MSVAIINDKYLVKLIESYKPVLQEKFYVLYVHDHTGPGRSHVDGLYRNLDDAADAGVSTYHGEYDFDSKDEELSDKEYDRRHEERIKEIFEYVNGDDMCWVEIEEVYLN